MKNKLPIALGLAFLLLAARSGLSADRGDASAELKDLVTRINAKLQAGTNTAPALDGDLKEFDTLLAAHQDEKTEAVARILYMKGLLYFQVLSNAPQALQLMAQVRRDFPATPAAQDADRLLVQASLGEGKTFPDFTTKDVTGRPLSAANYQGKVVLIDFWATWCPPCRAELPNVIKTYEKHHGQGFEIIGVSLDQDLAKLTTFTKEQHMPWPQYFDGLMWGNKLVVRYGVTSIPATFLLDGKGMLIARNLRGEALEDAVAKALAGK